MSNIAIVYGYSFQDLTSEAFDALEDFESDAHGVNVYTGYSVSSFEPDTAVIGVPVMEEVCMFSPVELTNCLTDEKRELVDSLDFPAALGERLINKTPRFLVYGFSDD